MIPKMPRGAIPSPRSDIAASEPYQPEAGSEMSVPGGEFPTPNHELAAAQPYRASGDAPESFLIWPLELGVWGNEDGGHSTWAEEAFAKACVGPRVFIPSPVVVSTLVKCGSSNFSAFMQTHGFQMEGKAHLDGPFHTVGWTNPAALNGAIANAGPVKIGIASASLASGPAASGNSGWAICGLHADKHEDQCASLCGYGLLAELVALFEQQGTKVNLPPDMPAGLCYAMYSLGSIGIIDRQSLMNIIGEAWVRTPTTIVKSLS